MKLIDFNIHYLDEANYPHILEYSKPLLFNFLWGDDFVFDGVSLDVIFQEGMNSIEKEDFGVFRNLLYNMVVDIKNGKLFSLENITSVADFVENHKIKKLAKSFIFSVEALFYYRQNNNNIAKELTNCSIKNSISVLSLYPGLICHINEQRFNLIRIYINEQRWQNAFKSYIQLLEQVTEYSNNKYNQINDHFIVQKFAEFINKIENNITKISIINYTKFLNTLKSMILPNKLSFLTMWIELRIYLLKNNIMHFEQLFINFKKLLFPNNLKELVYILLFRYSEILIDFLRK